jgi:4-hydroxybenzoate polyprenyltransferase
MSAPACSAAPAAAPPAHVLTRALQFLGRCIRFDEVLVLQGSPLLGVLFSIGKPTLEKTLWSALLMAGSCCLVAHVFVLNDWSGMSADLRDPHRMREVFSAKGVNRRAIRHLAGALLVLAVVLLSPFGVRTVSLALAIAGLSALYSLNVCAAKSVPILSSLLHVIGGMLHFNLGYSLFGALGSRSLEISTFFGLTFAAGHLNQEVRDYEGDRLNGIRTNAVAFGRARAFIAGLASFTLADLLLVVLAARHVVPRALVLVAALYPLHLWWSLRAFRAGLTFESVRGLRRRYRWLYAVIGLLMLLAIGS